MPFWSDNQWVPNKKKGGRARDLKNQDASLDPTQGATQEFNLLKLSPN
jgi:hypothetical protein